MRLVFVLVTFMLLLVYAHKPQHHHDRNVDDHSAKEGAAQLLDILFNRHGKKPDEFVMNRTPATSSAPPTSTSPTTTSTPAAPTSTPSTTTSTSQPLFDRSIHRLKVWFGRFWEENAPYVILTCSFLLLVVVFSIGFWLGHNYAIRQVPTPVNLIRCERCEERPMPEGWELRIKSALDNVGIPEVILERNQGLVCRVERGMNMLEEERRLREKTQRRLNEATKVKEAKKAESKQRRMVIDDLNARIEKARKELDKLKPALVGLEVVRGEAARKERCIGYITTIRTAHTIPSVAIDFFGVFKKWSSCLAFVIVTLSNLLICFKQADTLPQSKQFQLVIISIGSYGFAGICTVVSDVCEGFPPIKRILRPIFLLVLSVTFIVSFTFDYANSEVQQIAQSVIFGVIVATITANHLGSDVYTKLWVGISMLLCICAAIYYHGSFLSVVIEAPHFQIAVFVASFLALSFDVVLYLLSIREP